MLQTKNSLLSIFFPVPVKSPHTNKTKTLDKLSKTRDTFDIKTVSHWITTQLWNFVPTKSRWDDAWWHSVFTYNFRAKFFYSVVKFVNYVECNVIYFFFWLSCLFLCFFFWLELLQLFFFCWGDHTSTTSTDTNVIPNQDTHENVLFFTNKKKSSMFGIYTQQRKMMKKHAPNCPFNSESPKT